MKITPRSSSSTLVILFSVFQLLNSPQDSHLAFLLSTFPYCFFALFSEVTFILGGALCRLCFSLIGSVIRLC